MARKATRRGHRQRPCSAHGRRRFRHNRLTWPLLDKRARMARLHCTRNQRHERKGQTRREHPPRIRFLSCHHVTPRGWIIYLHHPNSGIRRWWLGGLRGAPQLLAPGHADIPEGGSRARHEAAARKQPDRHTCLRLYPSRWQSRYPQLRAGAGQCPRCKRGQRPIVFPTGAGGCMGWRTLYRLIAGGVEASAIQEPIGISRTAFKDNAAVRETQSKCTTSRFRTFSLLNSLRIHYWRLPSRRCEYYFWCSQLYRHRLIQRQTETFRSGKHLPVHRQRDGVIHPAASVDVVLP